MAGGKGTRLRPLTWHLPKPMVPLLDRPCMEYIIDLLKRYGITGIAVTVQYLPQVIKSHFGNGSEYGVRLHYFEEETPLGTAGSVKNAESFLDDTFVVVSGDALTDFNLRQAIAFHEEKKAIGTLVMTQVEVPIEYGVVMTDSEGKVIRFLEKPSWSEVFSNTVNTGIYIFEPEVLSCFEAGKVFDFSKDLFPFLLKNDYPLYGYVADGYWSDIGNLVQYRQTQFDMLNGLVDVEVKGRSVRPGVRVADSAEIHPSVAIEGPAFIGEGTVVAEHAKLGPYTVVGRFNRIHQGAQIERSVIWNRTSIGPAVTLKGTTVCAGVRVGSAARLQENTVVGENSRIGENADLHTNVKVWPNRYIEADTILRTSLIWGKTLSSNLFENSQFDGIPNIDLTPEFCGKLISAYASCLRGGATVTLSCDDEPYSRVIKYSVVSSLLAAGIHVQDMGPMLAPLAAYGCRLADAHGGIHIYGRYMGTVQRTVIRFFDGQGRPLPKAFERKMENAFFQEDYAHPDTNRLGRVEQTEHIARSYFQTLLARVDVVKLKHRRFKVVYGSGNTSALLLMNHILAQLGCMGIMMTEQEDALTQTVAEIKADVGVYFRDNGATCQIVTAQGQRLDEREWEAIRKTICRCDGMVEDSTVPMSIESDAFCAITLLLHYLAKGDVSLHHLVSQEWNQTGNSKVGAF